VILPDLNVLISAYRRDSVDHARYKRWLEDVVNGRSAYGMSPQVVGSLVRVCTHPQVFAVPDCCEDVLGFGRTLLEQPNATFITPGARHWSIFEGIADIRRRRMRLHGKVRSSSRCPRTWRPSRPRTKPRCTTSCFDPIIAKTVNAEIIKLRDLERVTSILVTHQLEDAFYAAMHEAARENGRYATSRRIHPGPMRPNSSCSRTGGSTSRAPRASCEPRRIPT
jgi:predicted nucleic acid-binding protein